jgi:hypothetical protein
MENQQNISGNLPLNINSVTPTPNPDAQSITQLVKHSGRIEGYQLSNGQIVSKQQGVELAKSGGIRGVAVAVRNGSEYLRSLPDGQENNNLGNLPSITQ